MVVKARALFKSQDEEEVPFALVELPPITNNLSVAPLSVRDLVFALAAGSMGAAISALLLRPGMRFHIKAHTNENFRGLFGHGNAPCDVVKGRLHRLKFGHDLLNPVEIFRDNSDYYGGPVKGLVAWLAHLFADSFSSEGLPLPGLKSIRKLFRAEGFPDYHEYRKYMTLKGRDVAGAALIEVLLHAYFKTEKLVNIESNPWDSTRVQATRFFAHGVSAAAGLMLPYPSSVSINYPSIAIAAKSLWNLTRLGLADEARIGERQEIIEQNGKKLVALGGIVSKDVSQSIKSSQQCFKKSRVLFAQHLSLMDREKRILEGV